MPPLIPEKKQTGWICRGCHVHSTIPKAPCVIMMTPGGSPAIVSECALRPMIKANWEKFYGRIEENVSDKMS